MIPITQIAYNLNLTPRAIASRFEVLGIKGKKRILTYYFTKQEVEKITFKKHKIQHFPLLSNPNNYHNQIDVIEMHLKNKNRSAAEISRVLNISISLCERSIKYFKERQCLIIKSKL